MNTYFVTFKGGDRHLVAATSKAQAHKFALKVHKLNGGTQHMGRITVAEQSYDAKAPAKSLAV